MIYAKKTKIENFHLNGISANFCCFIICDFRPLLPEPVTYVKNTYLGLILLSSTTYISIGSSSVTFYSRSDKYNHANHSREAPIQLYQFHCLASYSLAS